MVELPRTKVLLDRKKATSLAEKFPPLALKDDTRHFPIIEGPAVFLDADGAVLAWSLPDLFPPWVQVSPVYRRRHSNIHTLH